MKRNVRESGFSLVELLISILILGVVLAGIFHQIQMAQTRYAVEGQKLDLTQQEREFVDQLTRDLHQAGYPGVLQFGNQLDLNSPSVGAGVWYISQTSLAMEGDVDGDGIVETIRYNYNDGSRWPGPGPNPSPSLQTSQLQTAPTSPWNHPS